MQSPRSVRRRLDSVGRTAVVAAAVALAISACSDGGDASEPVSVETVPSTVQGAADGVADGTEDGYDLDNLNVPGSDADDELDS